MLMMRMVSVEVMLKLQLLVLIEDDGLHGAGGAGGMEDGMWGEDGHG